MRVQLLIVGDPATGNVGIQGVIDDMRVVHWLLGEAARLCAQRANERDAKARNGKPQLVLATQLPPGNGH